MSKYEKIIHSILSDNLEFNSEDWGKAVNELLELEKLDENHAINLLSLLSSSYEFNSIISTAFVISNFSSCFILKNKDKIKSIIKTTLMKKCIRANIDLIPTFSLLLENQEDYILYNSLIESSDELESSAAISNLLSLNNHKLIYFNSISDFDFNLFLELPYNISREIYLLESNGKTNYYKKLLITSYYKHYKDKKYIYSMTDKSYEIFEYVYIYL